ncbi:molybdenum cofactor guanylyltransferase [Serinibacter salmoneus]|uniref:molybdenum cofactor guanylyltransferase n=1 Tax=Serinibacter salmoneus TaxID=556530 RepID=UPI000BF779EA|nr:NTP transferase domain-containing protein [Serinibacter salmoneus]
MSADSEPEPGWLPDAAIVLSGGRGSRLGGTPKGRVRVGDIPLLDGVLDAVSAAGIQRAVVVGHPPSLERAGVVVTREDPPFAGPLAGVAAGLLALPDLPGKAWVMVLACDLPRAGEVIPLLLTGSPAEDDGAGVARERVQGADGWLVVDDAGRRQWLAGCYRIGPLRAACAAASTEGPDGLVGLPLRAAFGRLHLREVPDPHGASADVDTPEDLMRARAAARRSHRERMES